MWLLILGVLLIIAALLIRWRLLPEEIEWIIAKAPVSLTGATELVFTVPDSVSYDVEVVFHRQMLRGPMQAAAHSVADGHKPGSVVVPAVHCAVYENGQTVSMNDYGGGASSADFCSGSVGHFDGKAGHTYTITATVPQPTDALAKMTPCIEVQYDISLAKENMVMRMIIILPTSILVLTGLVLAVVGCILMRRASGS